MGAWLLEDACSGALRSYAATKDGARPLPCTAFVIGVIAPANLTIIAMTAAGDLKNLSHIVNGRCC